MNSLWKKVKTFFSRLFGVSSVIPPEVSNSDILLTTWWDVYRARAPWLPYHYVTFDGTRRTRTRFTMNSAKILCSEMSGLVLSEQPEIQVSPLVKTIVDDPSFWPALKASLEYQGVLGGQAIKVYGNDSGLHLDFVRAQNFIPLTWDVDRIVEASFLDRRVQNDKSYIRVETHRKNPDGPGYVITSRAFNEQTGLEVPLDRLWPGVEAQTVINIDVPLFVYMKNPEANNFDPESPLGISLYANAIDTLQALDIAFDSFKTEILLGRQRIALPANVMRQYYDAKTQTYKMGFDPTDEAYIKLQSDDADKFKPVDLSGELRVDQFKLAIQTLLDILAVQTGFSSGYFSFDGVSMKTATEVISENSKTYKTIQSYRDILDRGLKQLFDTLNALGVFYNLPGADASPSVIVWDDGIVEDRASKMKYHKDLVDARLEDRVSALMKIHGIDEATAIAMADKINQESATVTNASLFGGA